MNFIYTAFVRGGVLDQSISESPTPLSVVEDVVEAVAEREGADPAHLPPLYDVCDPDALTALLAGSGERVVVEFTYCDQRVTVDSDGVVLVADDRPPIRRPVDTEEH